VNEGAFTDGWMMKVKMSNPADLDALMDAKAYEASCDN
jgi:glycine cleavage system H protein